MSFMNMIRPRGRWFWIGSAVSVALLLGVVGPFAYINFLRSDAPERLGLSSTTTAVNPEGTGQAGTGAAGGVDGTWSVGGGSQVGYRAKEVLFGQSAEAVGRTSSVTGTVVVEDSRVVTAQFTADLTSVTSDEARRDRQFHERIMDTQQHPEATFELTEPVSLERVPGEGESLTSAVTGEFSIHGVTKEVTFELKAQRTAAWVQLNGLIPVLFADYGIEDPSFGPAEVEDHGEIEFLLNLVQI